MQKNILIISILLFLTACSSDQKKPVDVISHAESSAPLEETLGVQEDQEKAQVKKAVKKKVKTVKAVKGKEKEVEEIEEDDFVLRDVFLIRISSNYNDKTYDLAVQVDKDNLIQSIKVRNNKKNRTKVYGLDRLNKEMTLVKTAGISLVSLKCRDFSPSRGCRIEIEYPYNLTYGNFDTFHANIRKSGDQWRFFSGNKPFRQMKLIAKKLFGLLIGVEKVELYQ